MGCWPTGISRSSRLERSTARSGHRDDNTGIPRIAAWGLLSLTRWRASYRGRRRGLLLLSAMPASGGVSECTSQHRRLITQCTRVKRLAFITRGRDHSSNRRRYVENTLSLRIIRAQQCRRLTSWPNTPASKLAEPSCRNLKFESIRIGRCCCCCPCCLRFLLGD